MIKMILAVDSSNAIGWKDGRLPWKIPADMKRFKELTSGGTVVMGWSTYKSLGRIDGLPNRKNLVLTRRTYPEIRGQFGNVDIISSLDYVRRLEDPWIIGGASVYDQALEAGLVDEIYLTLVDANSGADVTLKHDLSAWKLFILQQEKLGICWRAEIEYPHTEAPSPNITFVTLRKENEPV